MASFRQRLLLSELRQQGIRDPAVLDAMNAVPRERFIDPSLSGQAYSNTALPIGHGQSISQPFVVAFMTVALQVTKDHKVLEIGTGSGYQAAVLARLCKMLCTIERIAELGRLAEQTFKDLKISNIKTRIGDGAEGWPEEAPFDRIIVTAASKLAPPVLAEQLKPDGVMVLPLGKSPDQQHIYRLTKTDDTIFTEKLLAVRFVPLISGNNHTN
ncbi:protein-L-isoaspartate O-methyltransferase [bacterium MnTg02]|nr:protein-L-isoaspartate O-methyltransferase [bacterium MnTg02]